MGRNKEIRLQGISLSPGIACGKMVFLEEAEKLEVSPLKKEEVDHEILRYRSALLRSQKEMKHSCQKENSKVAKEILESHLEVLFDPAIMSMIEEKIRMMHQKTEKAFASLIEEYQERFCEIEGPIFQERIQDVVDVSRRILKNLQLVSMGEKNVSKVIFFAKEITFSDVMRKEAMAFVTERGGYNSHAAILARSRGIPYISNIDFAGLEREKIKKVFLDGEQARVILNPSEKNGILYEKKRCLQKKRVFSTTTKDGIAVECYGNIETPQDVDSLLLYPIAGIGIFRSEFLLLQEKQIPSIAQQTQIYTDLAQKLYPLPLTIRLFDLGGDKTFLFSKGGAWQEAFLQESESFGCRGIRFLLKFPQILEEQLLSIVAASSLGNVRLLLPFVTDLAEIREVKERLQSIKKRLASSTPLPLGTMVEVPAAALMADLFARETDFLSIGTNDLVQYFFASDRSYISCSKEMLPSLMKLLQIVVNAAAQEDKPLYLCGEMAAQAEFLPLFLQMGFRKFSLSSTHMGTCMETLEKISLS